MMDVLKRNNVLARGKGAQTMIFAHGFGCDQNMWRFVQPAFEESYRTVLYDHVGAGRSDIAAYSFEKYASLNGYATDLVEIVKALDAKDAIFVGHSVSAMIGVIAAQQSPGLFKTLILVAPSPYHLNEDDYQGGFTKAEIDELLASLDSNHLGWSNAMAPVIMANEDRPELAQELANSFCRTDPEISKQFAKTTFLSDSRGFLDKCTTSTLILQCSNDVIAPETVGHYVHAHIRDSKLVVMNATGHCPNLSAPEETIAAIKAFL